MSAAFFIITAVVSILYLAITLFLLRGLLSLRPSAAPNGLSYSVVIAAHNEEANIENCLHHVIAQTIPSERYEIIVANDRSTDATREIAERFYKSGKNFSIVDIDSTPVGFAPKKYALSKAISRARHEIIIITDADCAVPPGWIETIDRNFAPDVGLVQGITTYTRLPGMGKTLFNLQAVDFLSHGIVSAAAIGAGIPLNSNANNLAFRKSAFDEVGGYGRVRGVVSGDDDLIVQRIARPGSWKARFMTDLNGAVTTQPTTTPSGAFEQRKRWGSKTVHYNPRQIAMLSTIFTFYVTIVLSTVAALFQPDWLIVAGLLLVVKLTGESLLMIPGTRIFGQQHLRLYIVPASLIHLPVAIFAVLFGVFGRFKWKEAVFTRTMDKSPPS